MAGTVEQVGPAVTEFAPGEEVLGYVRKDHVQWGTYAELVAAPVRTLAHRPPGLDVVTAGALPLVGLTALQALRAAGTGQGDTVLVHAVRPDAEGLGWLAERAAEGRITVEIQQVFDLAAAPDAHRLLEEGHVRGKLVLRL